MSGSSSSTWGSRSTPLTRSVPSTNVVGSCGSSIRSPPIPAVVLMMTSTSEARIRSTTSRYSATSRDPLPVSGSRTWMCTMVAPARAAAMPDSAICSGVTGTCSERPTVSPAPVRAQVIMTLRFTVRTPSVVSCIKQGVQAEIAEVAGLAVDQEVVVGPLRGLHDDGAGAAVGARELAAAAVGGQPAAAVVHRPPVVAEAGVGGDAARAAGRAPGRGTPAARRPRPSPGPAALAAVVRTGHGQQGHARPVAGGRGQPAPGHRHPGAVDRDGRVAGAAEVLPQPGDVVGVGAAGGALAHPVEHLGVGGAVAEPGAGSHAGPDLARAGRGSRRRWRSSPAAARRGCRGRGGPRPSRRRWSW